MPITPETRDRLTAGRLAARPHRPPRERRAPPTQLYGDLPSFGWALLVPLERDGDQRCSALAAQAGVDVSVASRQLAVLERAGYVERRPDPRTGGPACSASRAAGDRGPRRDPRRCAPTGRVGASPAGTRPTPALLSDLLDRLVADLTTAAAAVRRPHAPMTAS